MNKSFKVVFNKARGALMVVNEVTSSVQAKGTKTVIAAAVSTLMASAAVAGLPEGGVITNEKLPTIDGVKNPETTKLVAGHGQTVNIQTSASVGDFANKVSEALKKPGFMDKISGIYGALQPDGQNVILTGVTGGNNVMDQGTANLVGSVVGAIDNRIGDRLLGAFDYTKKVNDGDTSFIDHNETKTWNNDTHIIIGKDSKDGSNPLVLGVIGGDLYASLTKTDSNPELLQNHGTNIDIANGNVAGVVGGSVAIQTALDGTNKEAKPFSSKVSVAHTNLNIHGFSNVGGIIGGGVAVGLKGSTVSSNVTGNTHLVINMNNDAKAVKLDGIVVGVNAGGLSVATGGATASSSTDTINVEVENGEVLGLIGGGSAVNFDFTLSSLSSNIKNKFLLGMIQGALLGEASGTSTNEVNSIAIKLGANSSTTGVIGGSLAISDASNKNSGSSTASVGTVTLELNGSALPDDKIAEKKGEIVQALVDLKNNPQLSIESIGKVAGALDIDGFHFATLGSGAAIARGCFYNQKDGSTLASSTVGTTTLNLNGGYNVMTAAGGLAIASDIGGEPTKEGQTQANATVNTVNLNINGGENVLVTAGGLSYATGDNGEKSGVIAKSEVANANVNVNGGVTDGLYLGGIAVDDTNSNKQNAFVKTGTVTLELKNGEINSANLQPITDNVIGDNLNRPTNGNYGHQTATFLDAEHANVALLGGGMASGAGANATTETVNMHLNGGKVVGNIVAGGVATLGGKAKVGTATITVAGSDIEGNIYGGGLAGNPTQNNHDAAYKGGTSEVDTVIIDLNRGSIKGDVILGSTELTLTDAGTSTITDGTVKLNGAFDFQGDKIDGSGAKTATLVITGDVDLAKKTETAALFADQKNVVIGGFDNINGEKGSLKNADFEFGNKDKTTITGGQFDFAKVTDGTDKKIMTLEGNAAVAITGDAANKFVVTNGVLGLGTDATAKDAADAKGNYPGDAALYLSGTVNLEDKTITVGKTEKSGVAIGKNGMLIVDAGLEKGETANQTVVTKVNGAITDDGGKLHYVNVAEQGLVQIAGTDKMESTVDNVLFDIVKKQDGLIGFEVVKDQGKLDSLGVGDFNTGALQQIAGQKDEASEFINSFMNGQAGVALSGADRNAKLKSAFNLGAAAGVQTVGIDSALMGIDEATKRASLTNVFNDGWTGFASVTGNQLKFGDSSDALETKTKLAGVAVGGEYTMGDMTFGALGHFGSGDVKGQGRNSGVKNDVDYYGFQAYAAKRINQFNVVGQLGYVMTKNDITHDVGQSTKVDADVFTMGVRGEMNYAINDTWNAVPYVGLNWLRVSTDAYTTNKGIRVDSTDQDLINMPIGVAISGDCSNVAGWTVRPVVDAAYVHTFGDTDLDATSHVGEAAMGTTLDVWSENVGRFSVGAEARNGNMGFGFKLGGAKGDGGHEEFFGQLNAKYVF